jgi:zinc protease
MKKVQLRPLHLPVHETTVLPNGITLHVLQKRELPLVSVRLMVNAGGIFDEQHRQGVADFAMRLLRRGTRTKSADEISESVDFVGATLGGFANEENAVVAMSTPTAHLPHMLGLLAEVTLEPAFAEKEVELLKRRTLAHFQNELDDPASLAERALTRGLWGDHAYGKETTGTAASIEGLTSAHLSEYHQTRFASGEAHLFVVGDVDVAHMSKLVDASGLARWSRSPVSTKAALPSWKGPALDGRVIIVDKPEQTQVQMRIGAKGIHRTHPDFFAVTVMNAVLGGGFTSRLMQEIRVKRGLSYGAGSGFEMMTEAGTFTVSSFTKTERVKTLIDVALAEVKKMKAKGPTPTELATVQRYISGLYPARLETNDGIAGAIADMVHHRLDSDWILQFRQRIASVTVKDAARVAKSLLFGDKVVVLVGNAKALRPVAERFGQVVVVKPEAVATL